MRFAAQESAVHAALAAAEKAVGKAEAAAEKRFESVNEFRDALSDASALNVSRQEYESGNRELNARVSSISTMVYMAVGGLAALQAVIMIGIAVWAKLN
jgi:hypothetical protein